MESSGLLQSCPSTSGRGRLAVGAMRVSRVRLVCGGMGVVVVVLILELWRRQAWRRSLGRGVVGWRQVTGGSGESAALTPRWWAGGGKREEGFKIGLCRLLWNLVGGRRKTSSTCVCGEPESGISPGGNGCGGEAVSDSGVLIPMAGWGETGWTVGERMRLADPRLSDWTASGALDWGFPHSAERGAENGGGKRVGGGGGGRREDGCCG